MVKVTATERFWKYVTKSRGCWIWTGAVTGNGYGVIRIGGKNVPAHRFSYELHTAEIGPGTQVCHTCDVPLCVNPHHLWIGTPMDNMGDKASKGRAPGFPGELNQRSKLTTAEVEEIKERYSQGGVTMKELGYIFAVSRQCISDIINGRKWKTYAFSF